MRWSLAPHFVVPTTLALAVLTGCPGDDSGGSDEAEESDTQAQDDEAEESDTGEPPDPNLIAITGGSFEMGCPAGAEACDADNPLRTVTVSDFAIERTEVTMTAYTECVDAGGCSATTNTDTSCTFGSPVLLEHPINCVSWQQAADYCAWKGRRLPTEAEWEYAARGAEGRTFPWGETPASCTLAHMFMMMGDGGDYGCLTGITANVGTYPMGETPETLADMAGNVDEWVADWYAADYYATGPSADPQGPDTGTQRVHRGGDFLDASPNNLRSFERWRSNPDDDGPSRGFRCAADG